MSQIGEVYLTHAAWVWLALGAALLAAEVATGSGWLLWAAGSAGVVAVIEAFATLPPAFAILIFAVLVIVSTATARRYFPRGFEATGDDINDTAGRLVGHEGRAVGDFSQGQGRVFVDGKEWAAQLDGAETLRAGSRIRVKAVSGARPTVCGV